MARKNRKPNSPIDTPSPNPRNAPAFAPPLYRGDAELNPFFASRWKPLLAVIAVAALARMIHFFFIRANDPSYALFIEGVDTYTFDQWSRAILAGDWLSKYQPVFYNGPAYAYFLALVYGVFGHNYDAAHIVNFALGTATATLVFCATTQWFSRRVAFGAGLAMALCSGVIYYEGTLLPEAFSFCIIAAFLCLMGMAQNGPNRLYLWPLMGIFLALAIIQRASILLCVGGVGLWVLVYFRNLSWARKLACLLLFGIGLAMPLSLTFLHNLLIGKQAVLVTSNGPNLLFLGNVHDSVGTFTYPPSWTRMEEEMKVRKVNMTLETIKDIRAHPVNWVRLMFKKFYLFWASFDPPDNFSYDLFRQFSPITRYNPVGFSILIPLAFLGIAFSWHRWRSLASLYLFLFLFCMSIVIIFIDGRYRIHILTGMVGFSSLCAWRIYAMARNRKWPQAFLSLTAIGLLMVAMGSYAVIEFRIRPNDFSMLARYYWQSGRTREAAGALEKAERHYASRKPRTAREKESQPYLAAMMKGDRARFLVEMGDYAPAERLLKEIVADRMARQKDLQSLVQALLGQGRSEEAIGLLQNLAQSYPDLPLWKEMLDQILVGDGTQGVPATP